MNRFYFFALAHRYIRDLRDDIDHGQFGISVRCGCISQASFVHTVVLIMVPKCGLRSADAGCDIRIVCRITLRIKQCRFLRGSRKPSRTYRITSRIFHLAVSRPGFRDHTVFINRPGDDHCRKHLDTCLRIIRSQFRGIRLSSLAPPACQIMLIQPGRIRSQHRNHIRILLCIILCIKDTAVRHLLRRRHRPDRQKRQRQQNEYRR